MILTVILAMLVVWCMFYHILSNGILAIVCLLVGGILAMFGHHKHEGFLIIDSLAQQSGFYSIYAGYKLVWTLLMMIICLISKSAWVGLGIAVLMCILTVAFGKTHLDDYLSLMMIPIVFIMISTLALLFEVSTKSSGVVSLPFFSYYLVMKTANQLRAILVFSRAFGAVSCLYFLSLSTPITELINVLRKIHVPAVIGELMYLIYRYIFILFEMHHTMKNAAKSRLGYINYKASMRTTGAIYSNLLAGSYRKAGMMFDAMESRCFENEIRFLEQKKGISHAQMCAGILIVGIACALVWFLR